MNPERAALMAGGPMPSHHQNFSRPPPPSNRPPPTATWTRTANPQPEQPSGPPRGEKRIKPVSRSQKKQAGQKKQKRAWTKEKPTSKRSQRAGPRSLAKQGLRVRLPKTAEQKAKQAERKEFRVKQKSGAAARKVIKTARREGYRVVKRIARPMKEYQARYRLALIAVEQEVSKKIHNELDEWERRNAMTFCKSLGFTIENTPGTEEIKPRVLGMKGKELDIDNLEKELQAAEEKLRREKEDKEKFGDHQKNRVDLSKVRDESKTTLMIAGGEDATPANLDGDFFSFEDPEDDNDAPVAEDDINYNHKMRRKLNRAILAALIKKENLVRARALAHCKENNVEYPTDFTASHKPAKLDRNRMLVDGNMETAKQERTRKRVEQAKYNELARAFRKVAKAAQKKAAEKAEDELLEQLKQERLEKGLGIEDLESGAKPWAEHFSEKSRRVQREKKRLEALSGKKNKSGSGSDSSDGSDSDSSSDGEASGDDSSAEKSRPSKKRARDESDEGAKKETKKVKFSEDLIKPASSKESSSSSENSVEVSKPKKKSKKTVTIVETPEIIMEDSPAAIEDNTTISEVEEKPAKKVKKEKKDKKSKNPKSSPEENDNAVPESNKEIPAPVNDWNADALDGDAARKDKFLRLLGGKKDGVVVKEKEKKGGKEGVRKVESELERQFQQGIELKHGGGKKRGIGA